VINEAFENWRGIIGNAAQPRCNKCRLIERADGCDVYRRKSNVKWRVRKE
jgi:hypothetical protein